MADHKKEGEDLLQLKGNFECPPPKIKSLEKVKKKIRNWEIMSQLEVEIKALFIQKKTDNYSSTLHSCIFRLS